MISVLCLISSYMYPNIAAFRLNNDLSDASIVDIYAAFESLFLIDMVLRFFAEQLPKG